MRQPSAVLQWGKLNDWSRLAADLEFSGLNDRRLRNPTFTLAERVGPLPPPKPVNQQGLTARSRERLLAQLVN